MRGEAHEATIRSIGEGENGPVVYERKAVDALSEKDLDQVKDAKRNHRIVAALREWIGAGKPKDKRPVSPKGDAIRKVESRHLQEGRRANSRWGRRSGRDGARGRVPEEKQEGESTNTFSCRSTRIRANRQDYPQAPRAYVRSGGDEEPLTAEHEFMFALNQLSFLEVERQDGTFIDGYFRALDRNTGAIKISPHNTLPTMITGIGARGLRFARKYQVDRLGRRYEIQRETRTWHGVACT